MRLTRRIDRHPNPQRQRLALAVGFYLLLLLLTWRGQLGWQALLWYAVLGVLSGAVYNKDKTAARQHQWRVPERWLLLLASLGGWPAALWVMQRLRHKIQKSAFMLNFYLAVTINMALLLGWLLFFAAPAASLLPFLV